MIGVIIGLTLIGCFYGMVMCKAGAKKQPKPGQDFDERGMYDRKPTFSKVPLPPSEE